MKTLTEAIEILEEYLHFSHNVDPIFDYKVGVSRIYHIERELYWQLVQCRKEKTNSKEIEPNVGGAFIIDKQDGKIYMIGSSPAYDWEKEFSKFRLEGNSQIDWKEYTNEYQNCKLIKQSKFVLQNNFIECHINNRENTIEDFVKTKFQEGLKFCSIKFMPFEKEVGQIEISTPLNVSDLKISTVSKMFQGPLANSSETLNHLKKYLRINGLQISDNYWIEINQDQKHKSYLEWKFQYKMEYKELKSSI